MKAELPICSVSGGKDSTALYGLMVEYYGQDFLPIFADTGHEHPVTVNYVKNLHIMAGGPPVVIVRADFRIPMKMRRASRIKKVRKHPVGSDAYKKALAFARKMKPTGHLFLDMMVWQNAVPTSKSQFCTEHLKLWPIMFYLEKHYPRDRYEWVTHTGMRAQESVDRASRQPFEWDTFFNCMAVKPLIYQTEDQIFEYLALKGIPPNPLYEAGNSRVGCYPCRFANKQQLANLPDWAWERLKHYEQVLGISWFYKETLDSVRDWSKTTHGGRQYGLFLTADQPDTPSCVTGWKACE